MFVPNTFDLISILCAKETRKINAGAAFSFYGQYFVVAHDIRPGTRIEVIAHRKYGIFALYNNQRYDVCRIEKPIRKKVIKDRVPYIPPDSHRYKYGKEMYVQYSSEYTDAEVLAIIDEIFLKSFK